MSAQTGSESPGAQRPALYLARHGETDWNREPARCQGWSDVPLNECGREQAHELGRRLAGLGIDLIVASHLARARETAELVRAELQRAAGAEGEPARSAAPPIELRVDERLAETDRGEWEGRTFADIARDDAETWRAYKAHPETFTFPGGESFAAQQRRVLEAVRDAALTRRVALLVTHGGSIRLVRAFLEARGIEAFHEISVPNGEILRIDEPALPRRIDALLHPPAHPSGTG